MLVLGQGRRMDHWRLMVQEAALKANPSWCLWGHEEADGPRARGHYRSINPDGISEGINSVLAGHSSFSQMCWRYRRPALQERNWWEKLLWGIECWCSPCENAPQPWGVWNSWAHRLWKQSLIPAPAFLYKDLRLRINWIPSGEKDPPSATPRNISQEISSSLQRDWAFPLFAWNNSGPGTKEEQSLPSWGDEHHEQLFRDAANPATNHRICSQQRGQKPASIEL